MRPATFHSRTVRSVPAMASSAPSGSGGTAAGPWSRPTCWQSPSDRCRQEDSASCEKRMPFSGSQYMIGPRAVASAGRPGSAPATRGRSPTRHSASSSVARERAVPALRLRPGGRCRTNALRARDRPTTRGAGDQRGFRASVRRTGHGKHLARA
ncbi:hypothetical protein SACE_4751 [Saccharopolyspora erythraea NRRL 2338]|uniref:Uncharacterized protein n=1 Tax=Saccharopolyspora erythraea (strain ATCC 11635 / DSM 40517 / JCM 4748 / NBRC 13426 / NCIMB 8594 / NRRL 2338) TaxID=405948 RepID=A4FIZ4_SACEN|nr:hypothetical protein SACE_4751 [Saccharopolyspora erythraea NRRL 2338]